MWEGIVELDASTLRDASPEISNARGIVLADRRVKFVVEHEGKPVAYVASLYVQRAPLDENETADVDKIAATRKAVRDEKLATAAKALQNEKAAAFALGQSSTFDSLRHINELAKAASALGKLAS